MNLSGIGLKHMMNVNKIKDKQLIVMHDDVDLPLVCFLLLVTLEKT